MEEGHDIGWAVMAMQGGDSVTRIGWNGPGQYLRLQVPDSGSANTLPYIWIRTVDGHRVPWLASQTDLLSHDWVEARHAKSASDRGSVSAIRPEG